MAMTYRQAINAVLSTIGSATIPAANTTVTDTYQLQVCEFFNQILEEVALACQWRSRWVTYNVFYGTGNTTQLLINWIYGSTGTLGPAGTTGTVIINGTPTAGITTGGANLTTDLAAIVAAINAVSGTTGVTAALTPNNQIALAGAADTAFTVAYGAGANVTATITGVAAGTYICTAPNSKCSVVEMMNPNVGYPVALCFDTTSVGIPFPLKQLPIPDLMYMNQITSTTPVQYSTHFALQDLGNDDVNMLVYPASSLGRNLEIVVHNPLPRFDPTAAGTKTDLAGVVMAQLDAPILIPPRPIVMGTIWMALEERGEELGLNSQFSEEKWRTALADEVSRDVDEAGGLILIPS